MSGDQVNVRASSWYKLNGANAGTPVSPMADLLASFSRGIVARTIVRGKFRLMQLQAERVLNPGIGNIFVAAIKQLFQYHPPEGFPELDFIR